MAFTESWVETDPDGSVIPVSQLDNSDRLIKRAVRERLEGDPASTLSGVYESGSFGTTAIVKQGSARAWAVAFASLGTLALQDGRIAITTDTNRLYHLKGTGFVELAYLPLTGGTVTGSITFTNVVNIDATAPRFRFHDTDGTVDKRKIDLTYTTDRLEFEARTDAGAFVRVIGAFHHDGGMTFTSGTSTFSAMAATTGTFTTSAVMGTDPGGTENLRAQTARVQRLGIATPAPGVDGYARALRWMVDGGAWMSGGGSDWIDLFAESNKAVEVRRFGFYAGGTVFTALGAANNDYPSVGYNFVGSTVNGSYTYRAGDSALRLHFNNDRFSFLTAPTGLTGNPITWSERFVITTAGTTSRFGFTVDTGGITVASGTTAVQALTATTVTATGVVRGGSFGGGTVTELDIDSTPGSATKIRLQRSGGTGGVDIHAGNTTTVVAAFSNSGALTLAASVTAPLGIFNDTAAGNNVVTAAPSHATFTGVGFRSAVTRASSSAYYHFYATGNGVESAYIRGDGVGLFQSVTVTSSGITVNAGGLTVSAGTTAVQALTTTTITASGLITANGGLTMTGTLTASALNLGGATVTDILTGTATVNMGSIPAGGSANFDITVTGAALDDAVFIGAVYTGAVGTADDVIFYGRVSAVDTVRVTAYNISGGARDPDSRTFRAVVFKF